MSGGERPLNPTNLCVRLDMVLGTDLATPESTPPNGRATTRTKSPMRSHAAFQYGADPTPLRGTNTRSASRCSRVFDHAREREVAKQYDYVRTKYGIEYKAVCHGRKVFGYLYGEYRTYDINVF